MCAGSEEVWGPKTAGRVIITMIGPVVGGIGHKIWWYSEDKHRHIEDGEVMGMTEKQIIELLNDAGFNIEKTLPLFMV